MTRNLAVLAAVTLMFALGSEKTAHAQGAVVSAGYGGYYGAPAHGATVHSPPLYPAYGATVYSPPLYPAYGAVVYSPPAYVAPAPPAYGVYAPGYGVVYPRNGMEIEYKYKRGLWYVEIDD